MTDIVFAHDGTVATGFCPLPSVIFAGRSVQNERVHRKNKQNLHLLDP
jgi:hypothetical protein